MNPDPNPTPWNPPAAAYGHISMELSANYKTGHWPENVVKGRLDDRRIRRYEKAGYYSPEIKEFRKQLAMLRQKKKDERELRRSGNFLTGIDGKLIYSPL